jgi:hypothetical protein
MNVRLRNHNRYTLEIACENSLLVGRTGVVTGTREYFHRLLVPFPLEPSSWQCREPAFHQHYRIEPFSRIQHLGRNLRFGPPARELYASSALRRNEFAARAGPGREYGVSVALLCRLTSPACFCVTHFSDSTPIPRDQLPSRPSLEQDSRKLALRAHIR